MATTRTPNKTLENGTGWSNSGEWTIEIPYENRWSFSRWSLESWKGSISTGGYWANPWKKLSHPPWHILTYSTCQEEWIEMTGTTKQWWTKIRKVTWKHRKITKEEASEMLLVRIVLDWAYSSFWLKRVCQSSGHSIIQFLDGRCTFWKKNAKHRVGS